jgi:hypothetical protein
MASDAAAGDYFGNSVSISGDYIIVGAGGEDSGGSDSGAAYIFHRTGINAWDTGTKIVAPDAQTNDYFGGPVSINGDYVIVGAGGEDSGGSNSGAAYIFHRTGINAWDTGTKIVAPDAVTNDSFGSSVSINGNYAIVGAVQKNIGPIWAVGAAYIFHRTGTNTWDAGTKIMAFDPVGSDQFGSSVSISGDYAIAGVPGKNSGDGAVYIFHRTGTNTWDAGIKIIASDAATGNAFGGSVSISGDYIVAGANEPTDGGIYIYHRIGTNVWDSGIKIPTMVGSFGTSVSIDGDYVVSGSPGEGIINSGAARIYHRIGTNIWDSGIKIVAYDPELLDSFGGSVSINGNYIVIGARNKNSYAGAAYVFYNSV